MAAHWKLPRQRIAVKRQCQRLMPEVYWRYSPVSFSAAHDCTRCWKPCWRPFYCWYVFGWQPWRPAGWLVYSPYVWRMALLLEQRLVALQVRWIQPVGMQDLGGAPGKWARLERELERAAHGIQGRPADAPSKCADWGIATGLFQLRQLPIPRQKLQGVGADHGVHR